MGIRRTIKKIQRNFYISMLKIKTRNGMLLRNIQGSKMYLDLRDKGISRELIFNDIREEKATLHIKKTLKKDDIVIDIGANIGYFALMEAKSVGNNGKVYAVEPVSSNFELLKRNITINGYSNVEVFNFAFGHKNEVRKLYLSSKYNWHAMVPFEGQDAISSVDVNVYTMDTFLKNKEYPGFVRMDVEGYESRIIQGMEQTLKNNKPLKLFIELHPHIMKREDVLILLNTLKENDFEIRLMAKRSKIYEYTIDQVLDDESVMNGSKGAFQIFFERA